MPRKFSLSSLWGQGRPSKSPRKPWKNPRRKTARAEMFRFAPLGLEMLEELDLLSGTGEQLVGLAAPDNGSFETGSLSPEWSVSESRPDLASVVTSYQATGQTSPESGLYTPREGEVFALLQTGLEDQFTSIAQSFTVAAGETVSGWAFFDTTESSTFYNDVAEIRILQNGAVIDDGAAVVFASSVVGVGGNDGGTPWTFWQYTIAQSGTYTLEARTTNREDGVVDSFLGIDDVNFHDLGMSNTAPTIDSVTTVPEAIDQGEEVEYTLNFTDPDAGDTHSIVVNWGDGSATEELDAAAGAPSIVATHTYANFGSFDASVTLFDNQGGSDSQAITFLVNAAAPEILAAGLAQPSDTGVRDDGTTYLAQPSVLIRALDPSPSATGGLTIRILVDGVLDQESPPGAYGNSQVNATLPLAELAEGTHRITVEVRDAEGNSSFSTFEIFVDLTPPLVVSSNVSSAGGELRFVLELSENLDPATAANLANYVLLASGGDGGFLDGNEVDRTAAAQIFYSDAVLGAPPRLVIVAPLSDETYRLSIDAEAISDRAGNVLATGGVTLRAVHDTVGPQVERVVAFNALGGQPNAILIDFAQPLDAATVVSGNFTLELLGSAGSTVLPLTAQYTLFGNRVVVRPATELAAGDYRLTITGLRSAAGTPQTIASVHAFAVAAQTGTTLNSEVLAGNAESLNNFTAQLLETAETADAALSERPFLESILSAAREEFNDPSHALEQPLQLAEAVSQAILALFNERAAAQGSQNEYIVLWGRLIDIALPGAIEISLPNHPEWSMVLLRVQAEAGSPLVTPSQAVSIVTAGVTGTAEEIVATLTGTDQNNLGNSGGVIYLSPTGGSTEAFLNVSAAGEQRTLSAENISGFSLVEAIDAQVQADFLALLGVSDLSQVPGSFLIIWFDPVDFVLTDAQGQQVGHAGGSTVNQVPNAFYSGDGTTELLVIPNATGGNYNLSLVGAGSEFRGTATFVSNGQVVNVPLQGTLAAGSNVVAVLDFRGLGEPVPSGQEFTGLERSAAGLETLAAFSNAALAGLIGFAPSDSRELRTRPGENAPTLNAQAEEQLAYVLQSTEQGLLTAFTVPSENGVFRLRVVELQAADRTPSGPRPVEVRLDLRDDSSRIEIVFDRDLTPAQVAAAERVVLVWAGPDGDFDTADDQSFDLAAGDVTYDGESKTVSIAGRKLPPGKYLVKLQLAEVEAAAAAEDAGAEVPAEAQPAAPAAQTNDAAALDGLWQAWPAAGSTAELLTKLRPGDAADQNVWFEQYRDGEDSSEEAPAASQARWSFAAGTAVAAVAALRPKVRIRRRQLQR